MPDLTSKEIFALRKQGKWKEALPHAQSLFKAHPDDDWNLRALGWCLISAFHETENPEGKKAYAEELEALPQLNEDAVFTASRSKVKDRLDPVQQAIYQVRNLSKEGDHESAYRKLMDLRQHHGSSKKIDEAISWELFHLVKEELRSERPRQDVVTSRFRDYAKLDVEKPSNIHSRMLDVATRAFGKEVFPQFTGFFLWWDSKNIQGPDALGDTAPDGKKFPSTVEKTITALGKCLKEENDPSRIQATVTFIQQQITNYPDQEWFPYYLAVGLTKLGRREKALPILLPVVRSKISDFWAWSHLASCFELEDPRYLQCMFRALTCRAPGEEFLLTVRLDTTEALHQLGRDAEAGFELQEVLNIKQQHGWRLKQREQELSASKWFQALDGKFEKPDYVEGSRGSDDILLHDLPRYAAVVAETNIQIGEQKRRRHVLDVELQKGHKVQSVLISPTLVKKEISLSPGMPVSVCLERKNDRIHVLSLSLREGDPWDILPTKEGLLSDRNNQKRLSVVMFTDGSISICHDQQFPKLAKLAIGTPLECRVSTDPKGRTKVRHFTVADAVRANGNWKPFKGVFRPRDTDRGGGGHVDDVFVPSHLIQAGSSPQSLEGVAVKEKGKSSYDSWWKAVTAHPPITEVEQRT